MMRKTLKQIAVVMSNTAQGFQEELNKALNNHPGAEIQFNMTQGHCAYVIYEETVEIPEDARDRLRLQGIYLTCSDCPYFNVPKDKRVKNVKCKYTTAWARKDCPACNFICEMYEKGEL